MGGRREIGSRAASLKASGRPPTGDVAHCTRMLRRPFALALVMLVVFLLSADTPRAQRAAPDWTALEAETMRHFQAILRLDTSNPPGNESQAVDYLESILKKEGIETRRFANDPARANLVARLRGTGKKRPILIMGHTDVVKVDPAKWTHPPFSATRDGGYVYGRGRHARSTRRRSCRARPVLLAGVPHSCPALAAGSVGPARRLALGPSGREPDA